MYAGEARARGIAAEPPKPRSGEGDGADSPTRANAVSEAARPKEFCFAKFNEEWRMKNEKEQIKNISYFIFHTSQAHISYFIFYISYFR